MSIEEVKMYKSGGKLFETKNQAAAHSCKLINLAAIDALLKPKPDTTKFANGAGYVQQDSLKVQMYKREIMLMATHLTPKMAEWALNPIAVHPQSMVGRYLSDGDSDLYKAWHRVMCMDEQYREWGQPYFAMNPTEGEQFEVV